MARRVRVPKRLRVLVMMHRDLVPPPDAERLGPEELHEIQTEFDVVTGLAVLGHEVRGIGLHDELRPLRDVVEAWAPHVVFNLLEEFHGRPAYDHNVVSFLELVGVAYTGCNPRGMVLARDKALSKKILHFHRLNVPSFAVAPIGRRFRRPRSLGFPLIVKSLVEEASLGISQASVVHNDEKLAERVGFVHRSLGTDCIVEEYVEGRELYVGVLGNQRLTVLPAWELRFEKLPPDAVPIATRKVKWDPATQDRWQVYIEESTLDRELVRRIDRTARKIYRVLGLSGYARIDFRLRDDGTLVFLEANPNPDIARESEFPSSAESAGLTYEEVLQRIIRLGLARSPH